MLTSGDILDLELGAPAGREAGFRRPGVVVTAQVILDVSPNVVQVVPLTSTIRSFGSEVTIEPDQTNQLESVSSAQCQHIRAVSIDRVEAVQGNVGSAVLSQIRKVLSTLLDTT